MSSSSSDFSKHTSGYILNRHPAEYGSQQDDYKNEVQRIVKEMTEKWRNAAEKKQDPLELFQESLAEFGEQRHNLAEKHRTSGAEFFGRRADNVKHYKGSPFTPLSPLYEEYNKQLLKDIQTYLKKMSRTPLQFKQTELKETEETCLGRKSSLEVLIITFENISQYSYTKIAAEDYVKLCKLCDVATSPEYLKDPRTAYNGMWNLSENKQAMQTLKKNSVDEYKKLKLFKILADIKQSMSPNEKKTDWVLVTRRLEVDNKMYAVSQYITWLHRDLKTDPVNKMLDHSQVAIIHQDAFLIEKMMEDIAKLFKKIIAWDKKEIKELTNMIALFQFEFAHAMPFIRGSAAISEWFEMSLYGFHGFNVSYNNQKHINLEALVVPLSDFLKNYASLIKLEEQPQMKRPTPK